MQKKLSKEKGSIEEVVNKYEEYMKNYGQLFLPDYLNYRVL